MCPHPFNIADLYITHYDLTASIYGSVDTFSFLRVVSLPINIVPNVLHHPRSP